MQIAVSFSSGREKKSIFQKEVKMEKIMVLIACMALLLITGQGTAVAASGKCTVTDVAGNKMIIECTQNTKGFDKGTKIKIKSEKKKPEED